MRGPGGKSTQRLYRVRAGSAKAMRPTFLIGALAIALAVAAPAHAQGALSEAAQALRDSPVYVDPDAERALNDGEVQRLRKLIADTGAGPMYVAVLPESARDEAGGD